MPNFNGSPFIIGVIGGSICSDEDRTAAETVGRLIAKRKGLIICGGLGGVMEAVCKGASEEGGLTIGILPGARIEEANPYVSIPIATGMGIGRNIIIVRTARSVIAIGGKYGTLSEIAYALQLGLPVFTLNSWNVIPGVIPVTTPEEAVDRAFAWHLQHGDE
ncbi:MAG: TIGR00725 family protein [Calditrichaeota bacterium]|nr:MAG: TIGR00725 family protein [Calditrichota bacterium]